MTREEAINFLESLKDCLDKTAPVLSPDLEKALFVLKNEEEKVKLNRSRWDGCELCIFQRGILRHYGHLFCQSCGKPLTDEALEELERRINGG